MAYYMLQWAFKDQQLKAMIDNPQDRTAEAHKTVEAFGGRLVSYFFSHGEFHGVGISEFPDNESVTACVLSIMASGAFSNWKMTPLMTPAEVRAASERAKATPQAYKPPAVPTAETAA
jgi:uncharacterized protein with GYD domain